MKFVLEQIEVLTDRQKEVLTDKEVAKRYLQTAKSVHYILVKIIPGPRFGAFGGVTLVIIVSYCQKAGAMRTPLSPAIYMNAHAGLAKSVRLRNHNTLGMQIIPSS